MQRSVGSDDEDLECVGVDVCARRLGRQVDRAGACVGYGCV